MMSSGNIGGGVMSSGNNSGGMMPTNVIGAAVNPQSMPTGMSSLSAPTFTPTLP
jgi:hypothetical protein